MACEAHTQFQAELYVSPWKDNKLMKRKSNLEKLRTLDMEAQRIRNRLGISPRGEVLFQGTLSAWPDNDVVVEANGLGGATLLVVEGNYPVDYLTRREQRFVSEDAACEAAEAMIR